MSVMGLEPSADAAVIAVTSELAVGVAGAVVEIAGVPP